MNVITTGKSSKYIINKYNVFAEKLLKQKAKPLWDQQNTYTKAERDAALAWLAKALKVDRIGTRMMLQFVLRFRKMLEKRIRGYVLQCIRQKIPPELTLYMAKVPAWIRSVEAKLQMLPKLIEECRMTGELEEDRAQVAWAHIAQLTVAECHDKQRLLGVEDMQAVAAQVGVKNYHLLFRLWTRQRGSVIYKFRALQDAGDVARSAELALTQLEWKVLDAVLLYEQFFPLIDLKKITILLPFVTLYQLVIAHKIDEDNNGDQRLKWAKVVQEYSQKYLTSPSGVVLQRCWWELKKQVHDNIRERLRSVEYKVHPLLVEIAAKYPCIVRESQEEWLDMVKNGKVYDVSDIQLDDDSSDDDDSDEDDAAVDKRTCKATSYCTIDLDSDFECDDDRPLVIDEMKNTAASMPDLNLNDKENPEQKNTEPLDPDGLTVSPKKDQIHDLNATNTNINMTIVDHERNNEINMLNNEVNSQLNCLKYNESNPKGDIIKNNDRNTTDNSIKTDCNTPKDNVMTSYDSYLQDNFPESNNSNLTDIITPTHDSIPKHETVANTNILSLDSKKTTNPAGNTIKTYSKAKPVIDRSAKSIIVSESELQKLELEFQIQMRKMLIMGRAKANADKRKQCSKKSGDKIVRASELSNSEIAKVNKTELSNIDVDKTLLAKKKGVKMHTRKETKVNSAPTKIKTTDTTTMDIDKDKTTSATNMNSNEVNMAAKSLIENINSNVKATIEPETTKEIPNDIPTSIIATVYTCKGPDGRDLGHVILPAPLNKDTVTVSLKTDNGTVSINSAVVDNIKEPLNEIVPSNEPLSKIKQTSNDTIEPSKKSKESDLDLLQKIDPAQATTVIIFSDSEDENENVPIKGINKEKIPNICDTNLDNTPNVSDTNQENVAYAAGQEEDNIHLSDVKKYLSNHSLDDILNKMVNIDVKIEEKRLSDSEDENENVPINGINKEKVPNICDTNLDNTPKVSDTNQENVAYAAGQKEDNIHLSDVKKYLSNHSLDDILNKMSVNMDVNKEVKRRDSDNRRICESFIYVSDSDDDVTRSNEELGNTNDVSVDNENKEETNIQNDPDQVFEMVGCRSNDCTMINNVTVDDNIINNKIAAEISKEGIIQSDDVLNVPNANVLIIPPNFFCSPNTLASTSNITSPTPNVLLPPMVQSSPSTILIPPNVESLPPNSLSPIVRSPLSNVVLSTSIVPSLTPNVVTPISTILSSPTVTNPIPNTQIPPPMVLSRTPNVTRPTSNAVSSTPTSAVENSTSNVKIPTPNSNVVTMIINDKIGKDVHDDKVVFENIFDDVTIDDDELTINKNKNNKAYKNKSLDKKQRRTKTYSETAGYSGLFKLKDRSTKETVGMLCRIKEEKTLVNEVTEKIDNYLEKFKDTENDIEKGSEFYNIINKKLEIERKKSSNDGFLKKMLENCQAKTLWAGGEKSGDETTDEASSEETIDPKLIMDTRVYLPKLDEVETYNKNRRVDFSINTKRISKIGYKILNYKMKSDDPALITDNTEPKSTIPITEHIESEIAVALKNKIPEELKNNVSEGNEYAKPRQQPTHVYKSKTKPKDRHVTKLADSRTEILDDLTKQIKKEREIQQFIDPYTTPVVKGVTEGIDSLTEKIKNERQKQQLIGNNTSNIVQRIQFEDDDDSNSDNITSMDTNIQENNGVNTNLSENNEIIDKGVTEKDSQLQRLLQEPIKAINDNNKEFNDDIDDLNTDDIYDNEDMELDTVCNNTLILDSSNALLNKQKEDVNIVETSTHEVINENTIRNVNAKSIDSENIFTVVVKTDIDDEPNIKMSYSIKVEPMETHTASNDLTSDNDDIPINTKRNVKKRLISSDEERSRSNKESNLGIANKSLKKPRKAKKIQIISDEEDEEPKSYEKSGIASLKTRRKVKKSQIISDDEDVDLCTISDEEIGLAIENELLKEASADELLQAEDLLLQEMACSDDVPVKKSNIEEMLKLCKPFSLCLERVQVPKDTDSQVRKVELPDRSSLKRQRAPTAHVAPIRAQHTDGDDEGLAEVSAEGEASEAEIGNLLQQLTKETAFEWHRLEESAKPKRPRISDGEHSYARKDKKNETDQNNDRKTDRNKKEEKDKNKRKKDEKKPRHQKDSDDEIDANLEWQRQKNINYKFFNFNPISKSLDPDPNNTRKDKKNLKPNKKLDLLVRKVVVDDSRMQQTEVIDLDDKNEENNDNTIQNETEVAVESIMNDIETIVKLNQNTNVETIQVTAKGTKLLKVIPKEVKLTPIFTKIEPKFVKTDAGLRPKATEESTELIPIATKVEPVRRNPENEEPSKPSITKKYYSMKFRNFVQTLPKKQDNSNTFSYSQPSTSKDINMLPNDPVPSTSKESSHPGFICISDDSNEIFELTQTISVKNSDTNVTDKEKSAQSVSLQDLMTENNSKKQNVPPTIIRAPEPIITVSPATQRKSSNDNLNSDNEHHAIPGASIISQFVKVSDTTSLKNKDVNPAVKIMEITPISSVGFNDYEIDLDDNDFKDGLRVDENLLTDSKNKGLIETDRSIPRIENVMSLQYMGPDVIENFKNTSNKLVKEKSVRGLSLKIRNVRSIPNNKDLNHNKIEFYEPPDCNDENYDSDSDNLHIDESFTTDFQEAYIEPTTSKDLGHSSTYLKTDDKAKQNVITVLKFKYGKASNENRETPKCQSNIITKNIDVKIPTKRNMNNEIIDSSVTKSDSSNVNIGEISNSANVATEPTTFKDNMKSSKSIEIHSNHDKELSNDENESTISNSEEISETNMKDESNTIADKIEVPNTELSSKVDKNLEKPDIKNYNSQTNNVNMDVDETEETKIDEKDSLKLYTEERLAESSIANDDQDNLTYTTENCKVDDSTDITSDKKLDNSNTTTNIIEKNRDNETKPKENEPSTSKDNSKPNGTENNEPNFEKPKTFLKVVPIQKLRGEPVVTTESVTSVDDNENATKDILVRGQGMPSQCLSDDEATKSAPSDQEDACVGGNMPVISNVVSLSYLFSQSKKDAVKKTEDTFQSNVWNPSNTDGISNDRAVIRHVLSLVSSNPPINVADFIRDRDCTSISLLCIDEWRPIWTIHEEYLMVTNLKLPMIGATYLTVAPREQCTRLLMDDNSTGSTIVEGLSVPDEVFLDNNWYKKLSSDPMIYAKIWFVVPNMTTCKAMLSCNVKLYLYSRVSGSLLPIVVLNKDAPPKLTQYRINTKNMPELATLINSTLTNETTLAKPVSSEEIISLDSDDE